MIRALAGAAGLRARLPPPPAPILTLAACVSLPSSPMAYRPQSAAVTGELGVRSNKDAHRRHANVPSPSSFRGLHGDASPTKNNARSPYAVLNLRSSASKEDIKAAFRRLAKRNHPDLNPAQPRKECEAAMTEIIDAYDRLMDGDFAGRVGTSRVALACEMYSIPELRLDLLHDVYSMRLALDSGDNESDLRGGADNPSGDMGGSATSCSSTEISTQPMLEIVAHPEDSVSDLKRSIQSRFSEEWGMSCRMLDRDGIATGWEVVSGNDGTVLSYHLFLSSYGLKDGDVVHAVILRS